MLASLRLVMISKVGSQWILADKTGERMFTMPENWDISEVKCLLENKALVGHSMDDILKELLEKRGFNEGNTTTPGDFVIERAFVEK